MAVDDALRVDADAVVALSCAISAHRATRECRAAKVLDGGCQRRRLLENVIARAQRLVFAIRPWSHDWRWSWRWLHCRTVTVPNREWTGHT